MLVAFCLGMVIFAGPVMGSGQDESRQVATDALHEADTAVADAKRRHALWTTASEALAAAKVAFAAHDYDAARRHAQFAIEQARLGIAQLQYPPLRF